MFKVWKSKVSDLHIPENLQESLARVSLKVQILITICLTEWPLGRCAPLRIWLVSPYEPDV